MKEELPLEEQVARIRRKRDRHFKNDKAQLVLNTLFLILAATGLALYFFGGEDHTAALIVIGVGMLFKVAEFIMRLS